MKHLPLTSLTALAGALILLGCRQRPGTPTSAQFPVVSVSVQPIAIVTNIAREEVVATVCARVLARLEAKVSGRIVEVLVAPGQAVKRGQVLVLLEAPEIQARLEQARAVRQQAQQDFDRFSALVQQQAVTPAEFDAVQSRHRAAQAAEAEAQTMLSYTQVIAPFDGLITRKLAEVGDLAAPGRALLEVEDPTTLRLEADVPEMITGGLPLGAQVPVHVPAVNATLSGSVSEVAPAADPRSRTLRVKLDLPSTPGLKSGQFGRAGVPLGSRTTLMAPAEAVIVRGQLELVFVVANGRAQMRLVKTGQRTVNAVELLSGVDAGEPVVCQGARMLSDGQPVEVK